MKSEKITALPPVKYTGIRIASPKKVSGGLEAVKSSMKHVFAEVGVVNGTKSMLKVNQYKGFDCPGCAWPDPDDKRAVVEFCENGAKAVAEEATTKQVDPDFFAKYSVQELATWSDYELGKSGRLTRPMIIREGKDYYAPISWEEAYNEIANQLNALTDPNEAVFYTSGRTSNEAAYLYQLFVRKFGTNNLPDCSNMCHESSGAGLSETVGIGKGSVTLDDFYKSEVIVILGQNPGTNHPRMLTALQKAKKKGAKIISINPLKETGLIGFKHPQHPADLFGAATSISDYYLQLRINTDVPLLKAIMIMLLDRENKSGGVVDHEFIKEHTKGFEDLLSSLKAQDLEALISQTGLLKSDLEPVVDLLAKNKKIICCWAMGLTQHRNAVDNIREVVNLLLLKGSIGKEGAGTCPVRGHSNVQGDRTVGIWERLKPAFGKKLKERYQFDPPSEDGYDTVEAIRAMGKGKVKAFIAMGGNFVSASPDTDYVAQGLQGCELTVQISTKLNRSHLTHGKTGIILPCLGRTEQDMQNGELQFVSVENSTGVVHQSRGGKKPISPYLQSEPRIVAQLATHTLGIDDAIRWNYLADNYDRIREEIEATIPGFEQYNECVRQPGGFYLPNGAREARFHTKTGKANFTVNALPEWSLEKGEYIMMTIRSHDQFNTTIYGLNDRYRGIYNERRVILINALDMQDAGLKAQDLVNIVSTFDGEKRVAPGFIVVPYDIPRTCVATYFPEANALISYKNSARISNTPVSKSVIVTISKV